MCVDNVLMIIANNDEPAGCSPDVAAFDENANSVVGGEGAHI